MEVVVRRASSADVDELGAMRRVFTFEDGEPDSNEARPEYEAECRAFFADALEEGRWDIWRAVGSPT